MCCSKFWYEPNPIFPAWLGIPHCQRSRASLRQTTLFADYSFTASSYFVLRHLEHRLYQKTGEGPDALRDFIFIRRGIYQLDMIDVQSWARGVDAIRATCMKTVAADPAPPTIAVIADLR